MTVTARSPALGVLEFEAQATVTHPFNDTVLWWSVEVRKAADDGSFETVWEHDFDDLAHYTTAKKMVEVNAVLRAHARAVGSTIWHLSCVRGRAL